LPHVDSISSVALFNIFFKNHSTLNENRRRPTQKLVAGRYTMKQQKKLIEDGLQKTHEPEGGNPSKHQRTH